MAKIISLSSLFDEGNPAGKSIPTNQYVQVQDAAPLEIVLCFEGTAWDYINTPNDKPWSSIARLYNAAEVFSANERLKIRDGKKGRTIVPFFYDGTGSSKDPLSPVFIPNLLNAALGVGYVERVEQALWDIQQALDNPKILIPEDAEEKLGPLNRGELKKALVIDIYGWSRGSVAARFFINAIRQNRFVLTWPGGFELSSDNIEIRVAGLFDSVSTVVELGQDLFPSIPASKKERLGSDHMDSVTMYANPFRDEIYQERRNSILEELRERKSLQPLDIPGPLDAVISDWENNFVPVKVTQLLPMQVDPAWVTNLVHCCANDEYGNKYDLQGIMPISNNSSPDPSYQVDESGIIPTIQRGRSLELGVPGNHGDVVGVAKTTDAAKPDAANSFLRRLSSLAIQNGAALFDSKDQITVVNVSQAATNTALTPKTLYEQTYPPIASKAQQFLNQYLDRLKREPDLHLKQTQLERLLLVHGLSDRRYKRDESLLDVEYLDYLGVDAVSRKQIYDEFSAHHSWATLPQVIHSKATPALLDNLEDKLKRVGVPEPEIKGFIDSQFEKESWVRPFADSLSPDALAATDFARLRYYHQRPLLVSLSPKNHSFDSRPHPLAKLFY